MWHIIGDALGWRRGWLDGKGRAPPESIEHSLLHARPLHSYEEALADLTARGYVLWDVLCESERVGSLDGSIKNAVPADVRGLLRAHPTVRTICFASGASTATFFKRHFRAWLAEEGTFRVSADPLSQRTLGKAVPPVRSIDQSTLAKALSPPPASSPPIELVVMESVSPAYVPPVSYGDAHASTRRAAYAAAGYPEFSRRASAYAWKRQQWFEKCFARELAPDERAKRFGERAGDLIGDEHEVGRSSSATEVD